MGEQSGYYTETGTNNVAIGSLSGGFGAGAVNSFNLSTMIGAESGYNITTATSNIFIGFRSGYRQTTLSNLLIIDNQQRASVAEELTNSILYGVMAALPANQTLRINAALTVSQTSLFLDKAIFTQTDGNEYIDSLADGYMDYGATTAHRFNNSIFPATDDTYYLGKNDDDSPFAWKGVILKDTTDGKYYRIEVINGVVTATDLTD